MPAMFRVGLGLTHPGALRLMIEGKGKRFEGFLQESLERGYHLVEHLFFPLRLPGYTTERI